MKAFRGRCADEQKIQPAIGIIRIQSYSGYKYCLSLIWGFWGISFRLSKFKE